MQPVSIEQLIALNREIAALAEAGMPLEQGLVRASRNLSGSSSDLASRLAKRMHEGSDLGQAIDQEAGALPKSYRVLVHAGLRSGNLASALQGYTETASRLAELRRVVGLASLYPIFLIIVAWIFFLFASSYILPKFDWMLNFQDYGEQIWSQKLKFLRLQSGEPFDWMIGILTPSLVIVLAIVCWKRSAYAPESSSAGRTTWLDWVPGIAKVRRLSNEAGFSDLLSLFVEQQLPLTEALPLAADASGLTHTCSAAHDLATNLNDGQLLSDNPDNFRRLPPLIRLALLSNCGQPGLIEGLQRAAQSYHQRAISCAYNISLYLPLAATALIGGTVVGAYAFILFQPYVTTLELLSQ